jgi:two-component system, LytTR family, sensor kinase
VAAREVLGNLPMARHSDAMRTTKPVVRQVRILAFALGLWAGLVLLFATQFVLVGSFSWREAFPQALFFWGLWFLLMPATALIGFRFPFERKRIWQRLGIHLIGCVLVVSASQVAFRHFIPSPFPPPPPQSSPNRETSPPPPPPDQHPPKGFLGLRAGVDILLYWSLVGVCQGIANFRRSQQRERRAAELEARLTRSKLQALRMQINPHFLFNTLNAISTLIYVNPRAADEMLGDLSELLRRSLDSVEEQEIPLGRELQFIRAYIGIEQKRFGDRLRMEEDVPEELAKALIPALLLQPLVENAIRHGIEPQRAPGLIYVRVRREGERLNLLVRDNGKGLLARASGPERSGIGLANTQARLRELYGSNQKFRLGKAEPRGCEVEITLPWHTDPLPAAQPEEKTKA